MCCRLLSRFLWNPSTYFYEIYYNLIETLPCQSCMNIAPHQWRAPTSPEFCTTARRRSVATDQIALIPGANAKEVNSFIRSNLLEYFKWLNWMDSALPDWNPICSSARSLNLQLNKCPIQSMRKCTRPSFWSLKLERWERNQRRPHLSLLYIETMMMERETRSRWSVPEWEERPDVWWGRVRSFFHPPDQRLRRIKKPVSLGETPSRPERICQVTHDRKRWKRSECSSGVLAVKNVKWSTAAANEFEKEYFWGKCLTSGEWSKRAAFAGQGLSSGSGQRQVIPLDHKVLLLSLDPRSIKVKTLTETDIEFRLENAVPITRLPL